MDFHSFDNGCKQLYVYARIVYLQILGNVYTGLMQAAGASEKVFEYIDREPEIKNDGTLAPKGLKGQIEFKNVSFHYPSRPDTPVLKVCNAWHRFLAMA